MTTVRELMTPNPVTVWASESVMDACRRMAEKGLGALPIRGEDNRLRGMITDRDVVVKVLAEGKDPRAVHAGELAQEEVVAVAPDADADAVLRTMTEHKVRRLPVVEGGNLVGVVAQADVARSLPDPEVGRLVEALSVDT